MSSKPTIKEDLYQAMLLLRTPEETRRFLRDLMTADEIDECARRWQAARLLDQGVPYTRIQEQTTISSTTIARISRWLKKGTGGYRFMLRRIASHHTSSSTEKRSSS